MKIKTSVKLSETGILFLKKFRTNRRKVDADTEDLYYWELIEVIANYFKNNYDRYFELIKIISNRK